MDKKRSFLTLKQKIELIEVYNKEKLSVRNLSKRFNIGKTQASGIIKKREALMEKWHSNGNLNEKRSFLRADGRIIDQLCYEWFVAARDNGIPLTGPLIRSKAKEIAESLGNSTFNSSSGWLDKFKIRHNITFKALSREAESVSPVDVASFLVQMPSLIQGMDPLVPLTEQISEVQEISDDSSDGIHPLCLQDLRGNISTYKEALDATHDLKTFVECQGDTEAMNILSTLDLHFQDVMAKRRQTTI